MTFDLVRRRHGAYSVYSVYSHVCGARKIWYTSYSEYRTPLFGNFRGKTSGLQSLHPAGAKTEHLRENIPDSRVESSRSMDAVVALLSLSLMYIPFHGESVVRRFLCSFLLSWCSYSQAD
jgi:hypothetical protein